MSVFTLLLLLFIAYLCFKAMGNIWHDAFNGVGTGRQRHSQNNQHYHTHTNQQDHQSHKKANTNKQRPIEKGEGEYVDFEDVK